LKNSDLLFFACFNQEIWSRFTPREINSVIKTDSNKRTVAMANFTPFDKNLINCFSVIEFPITKAKFLSIEKISILMKKLNEKIDEFVNLILGVDDNYSNLIKDWISSSSACHTLMLMTELPLTDENFNQQFFF
jgi:hypothetical protein